MSKAYLYHHFPEDHVIDVSHEIGACDVIEGAYIAQNILDSFPPSTIHLLAVDAEKRTSNGMILIAKFKDQYLISYNSGLIPMIVGQDFQHYKSFGNYDGNHFSSIQHIFGPAAANLKLNGFDNLPDFATSDVMKKVMQAPYITEKKMIGNVLYFDARGIAYTNVYIDDYQRFAGNNATEVKLTRFETVFRIDKHLSDIAPGKPGAYFNDFGYLCIGIYHDDTRTMLGFKRGQDITIFKI